MLACFLENARSLASLLAIGLAALGLGRPLWQWIHRGPGPHSFNADDVASAPLLTLVWSVPLGMLAATLVLFPLAMLGWMAPLVVSSLTVLASILGVAEVVQLTSLWRARRVAERSREMPLGIAQAEPPRGLLLVLGLAALIVLCTSLVAALAPPTDGLEFGGPLWSARWLVQSHSLGVNSGGSPFVAVGFAWALILDGPVAASLLSWAGGIWLLLATAVLAQEVLGSRWSIVAALMMLVVPAVGIAMSVPLAATAVALWLSLACHAAQARLAHDSGRSWLTLLGVAAGAAIGADVRAWPGVLVVGGAFLASSIRARGLIDGSRELQRALTVALVIGGAAYLMGYNPWRDGGAGHSLAATVAAQQPTTKLEALVEQLGPTLWMLLPTLWLARRLRGLSPLTVVAGGLLIAAISTLQMQLLLAASGPLAIAIVWSCAEIGRWPKLPRRAAQVVVALGLLSTAALAIEDVSGKLPVAIGLETRQVYLLRELPGYRAALVINEVFGNDALVWSAEQAGLYVDGAVVTDADFVKGRTHGANTREADGARSSERELIARLRRREITHLLVSSPAAAIEALPTRALRSSRRRAAWLACGPHAGVPPLEALMELPPLAGASRPAEVRQSSRDETQDGIYCVSDYVAGGPEGRPRRYRLLLVR
jgi:hypothetical protein